MKIRPLIKIILSMMLIGIAALAGWQLYVGNQSSIKADNALESLKNIIPNLGEEHDINMGTGRDPLAAVSIDGIDIVGVIEVPSLDIMAPVTTENFSEDYFASWIGGSPVKGHFKILGGRNDLFRKLSKLNPGDRVVFTDIDGVRYMYEVTTQYHLKKWDEGDNEMMLCYESDKDTFFVVGCTSGTTID